MMMCSVCRKSDMLCGACSKLVAEGKITKTDITVARVLEKLQVDAEFSRTVATEQRVVIIAGTDAGRIIGKAGKNVRELSRALGKDVDVIETGDQKKMVEKILRVPALGVNTVYGAQEKYRVRVALRFKGRARMDTVLMGKILEKPVEVVFE